MKRFISALAIMIALISISVPAAAWIHGKPSGAPPAGALMAANGTSFIFAANGTSHICAAGVTSC